MSHHDRDSLFRAQAGRRGVSFPVIVAKIFIWKGRTLSPQISVTTLVSEIGSDASNAEAGK